LSKKTFEAAATAKAHLIVQLKENQPTLLKKVEAVCRDAASLSSAETIDVGRNRHETRTVSVFDASPAVVKTEWQPHVSHIIKVERFTPVFNARTHQWDARHEVSFYLSNRLIDAKTAASVVRKHWGIENKSHYVRDVTLREDASRIRIKPGIFARIRSFGFNILRLNQRDTIAQDRFAYALGGFSLLNKLIA
jgi:hypothetical protein